MNLLSDLSIFELDHGPELDRVMGRDVSVLTAWSEGRVDVEDGLGASRTRRFVVWLFRADFTFAEVMKGSTAGKTTAIDVIDAWLIERDRRLVREGVV